MKLKEWFIRLQQDQFAWVHILHAFLLSCLILATHVLIPFLLPYFPLTLIICLLIFQQSFERSRSQAILVIQTSLVGIVIATLVVLFLQDKMYTLPFVLVFMVIVLRSLRLGNYIVAPAILIIASYSMAVNWWYFLILGVDIAVHALLTIFLSERVQVKLLRQFQRSYRSFKSYFEHYMAKAVANQVLDATPLFQRMVQLRELFDEVKEHNQVSGPVLWQYDQLLLEIEESYFYLRMVLSEKHCLPIQLMAQYGTTDVGACALGDYNHVYVFHAEQLLEHFNQWQYLEGLLRKRGEQL